MDGTSIDPYFPPPIPIPGVSKSLLSGGKTNKNIIILGDFHDSLKCFKKRVPFVRYCLISKGVFSFLEITKTVAAVFPRGVQQEEIQ